MPTHGSVVDQVDPTHASFFSGVGGLDLGLERAGWRTVSFSEIDPYASAVLAERWPGVPNLGDIVGLQDREHGGRGCTVSDGEPDVHVGLSGRSSGDGWHTATLWTGGFPCQDLSVAGKRRGMGTADERTRSGLAYAFLDLVEQHRPPAILLENVPGLLSSNGGKDFGALLSRLAELGYWWAYRILDAQFFGVPQRRRRVFICALHAGAGFGADSPAAVLSVGTRCDGHSATSDEARTDVAERPAPSPDGTGFYNATARFGEFVEGDIAGNLNARDYKSANHLIGPPPDPGGVREADGLAGRSHNRPQLDALLPLGLDSHRYRCCGNGVVSNVSEWIGTRLRVSLVNEAQ